MYSWKYYWWPPVNITSKLCFFHFNQEFQTHSVEVQDEPEYSLPDTAAEEIYSTSTGIKYSADWQLLCYSLSADNQSIKHQTAADKSSGSPTVILQQPHTLLQEYQGTTATETKQCFAFMSKVCFITVMCCFYIVVSYLNKYRQRRCTS